LPISKEVTDAARVAALKDTAGARRLKRPAALTQAVNDAAPMLVNATAAARRVVEHHLRPSMTRQRIQQLAAPVDQGGDPDFPAEVPSESQERLWWWPELEAYFRHTTPRPGPRTRRPPSADPGASR
jgi:hypothetical protein